MESELVNIRDQQKESWNRFSPGWKKWDDFVIDWLRPIGGEMIRELDLRKDDHVLDIASGTGEPGLSIAGIVSGGKVVISDLAETMLDVARENAARKGITNFETIACDVSDLPFDNGSFDALTCRLGFMFFPDMHLAAREMLRVVKPGGKIVSAVWAMPEKNFWVSGLMGVVNKHLQLPPPKPGAPGMVRCGGPGVLAGVFKDAGLRNIREWEIQGKLDCRSNENYWNFMTEVIAPVVSALNKANNEMRAKIKQDCFELINAKFPDNMTSLDYSAILVSGNR
jgi:ubiquinone/menaquinone biosynthesis C-methylase UbiE